jgi:putative membrane protein
MNLILTTLVASSDDWDHHHWWPIWPLLWLVVIVAAVWIFKRGRWDGRGPQTGAERARGILAERFARGEITGEEYRERLEQLH